MADVFVSYKAEDRNRVAPLVRALESEGISVWWDAHIGGGVDWRATILRNLEIAHVVIVVWSKRSAGPDGQFVRDEATRAVRRKTYLPVRIDRIDLPLGFGETQAFDLIGWKGDAADPRYQTLLSALRQTFGVRPRFADNGHRKSVGTSRRTFLAGGVAAIAVTGVAGALWFKPWSRLKKGKSIAVMPFENLSGDPSQAYFSDGIAEELRSSLAGIPGLKVMARTSSEAVRHDDAVTAAGKLHVQDILTGSVRRSPQLIRITAQLINGLDGTQQWSAVYDRPVGDALKIQSEIADKVASELRLQLSHVKNDLQLRGGTLNARAQDLYLRSAARDDGSEPALRAALGYAEAALAEDPSYGDAMLAKAERLNQLSSTYAANADDAQSLAKQSELTARNAIQIAPLSPSAHMVLGSIYFWQFKFSDALAEFKKAESLGDHKGTDLGTIGWMLAMLKQFPAALRLVAEAVALDPLNPNIHIDRANVLSYSGRLAEAEQSVKRAIQIDPRAWYPHLAYAVILLKAGRLKEAEREVSLTDHSSLSVVATQAIIAERSGDKARSSSLFQQLLNSPAVSASYYQVAQVYAQQNRANEALAALHKAFAARDPGLAQIQTDYMFEPLRGSTQFRNFVKVLNFPS